MATPSMPFEEFMELIYKDKIHDYQKEFIKAIESHVTSIDPYTYLEQNLPPGITLKHCPENTNEGKGLRPGLVVIDDPEEDCAEFEWVTNKLDKTLIKSINRSDYLQEDGMNLQYPLYYTEKEGEEWKYWTYGRVDIIALSAHKGRVKNVTIKGQTIYALAFENPTLGPGRFPRWDAFSGWTTSMSTAKANNPMGKHGKIDARNLTDGWVEVK